jgi:hypothetical protein
MTARLLDIVLGKLGKRKKPHKVNSASMRRENNNGKVSADTIAYLLEEIMGSS